MLFLFLLYVRHLAVGSGRGLPGLYFYYDISPVQAVFEERRGHQGGFRRFLTSLFAIAGGSFTMFGLIDSFIVYVFNIYKQTLVA